MADNLLINGAQRDWARYARALDMRLDGATIEAIGREFGVTRQRASQMVMLAKQQLAFRIFKQIGRPLPPPAHLRSS
jgi:hypothetical protein